MRTGDEGPVAFSNIIQRQRTQAIYAKVFTHKRAEDIAMHDTALDVIEGIVSTWPRFDGREVAEQTPREGISCACGVDDFLQGIRWRTKVCAIGSKQQRPLTPLLDYDKLWPQPEELAHPGHDTRLPCILAHLFFTH